MCDSRFEFMVSWRNEMKEIINSGVQVVLRDSLKLFSELEN